MTDTQPDSGESTTTDDYGVQTGEDEISDEAPIGADEDGEMVTDQGFQELNLGIQPNKEPGSTPSSAGPSWTEPDNPEGVVPLEGELEGSDQAEYVVLGDSGEGSDQSFEGDEDAGDDADDGNGNWLGLSDLDVFALPGVKTPRVNLPLPAPLVEATEATPAIDDLPVFRELAPEPEPFSDPAKDIVLEDGTVFKRCDPPPSKKDKWPNIIKQFQRYPGEWFLLGEQWSDVAHRLRGMGCECRAKSIKGNKSKVTLWARWPMSRTVGMDPAKPRSQRV